MVILKRGITGFSSPNDNLEIKDLVTEVIRDLKFDRDFKVIEFIEVSQSCNYFRIKCESLANGDQMDIVINLNYPIYGGITKESSWMKLSFIELPDLLRKYFDENFKYLSKETLEVVVNEFDLVYLDEVERNQIKYWESKTFGDIIFNGYD